MNEQIKKLFTHVEDRLPSKEIADYYLTISNMGERELKMYSPYEKFPKYVTHWLDLSTLTTKEAAIEMTKDAFEDGYKKGFEFANQNAIEEIRKNYLPHNQNK